MHLTIAMQIDQDAYNSLGSHLVNDQKQSRRVLFGLVFAALISVAFLLWMVYGPSI